MNIIKLDTWAFKTFNKWFWRLSFRLTGRCGSLLMGHTPVFGNEKEWLWEIVGGYHTCSICGEQIKESKVSHYKNYSDKGRKKDMENLILSRKTATNDAERTAIDKSMYNIKHEEPHVKSMREELIKATRNNDHKKIKDIHEYVGERSKYKQVEK